MHRNLRHPTGSGRPKNTTQERKMTQKAMTKTQLVAALAEEMGADKKTAAAALDAVSVIVLREVVAGGSVTLPGVGKVQCRERAERQVRNPATGETMTKAADKAVKITIAKTLKDAVNG
jgi:DNA-binding protein HU-beta